MFCANCGKDLSPQAPACPQCGHPTVARGATSRTPDGYAIASLACAIGGLTVIPLIGSILGVVLGGVARKRIQQDPSLDGDALAKAGVIIGWVGLALWILGILLVILFFAAVSSISF